MCKVCWRSSLILLLALLLPPGVKASEEAFFLEKIEPILKSKCYECHSHHAGEASGGLVLDSQAAWQVGGDSGPAISPGNLDKSLLWKAVDYRDADLRMPPEGKLSSDELLLIQRWIETGAHDPRRDALHVEKSTHDGNLGRAWWSFQPLRSSTLPIASDNSPSRIDLYINQRLLVEGLTPAERSDWGTLIRRVSYDLTGLPPPPQMLVSTSSFTEQHYAHYVDQLLASPNFGEKWGRHWLDIARYADSNGSSFNVPFHAAWRYRNWVIEAFNQNLAIDEFIRKQIAGDLLPFESVEQRDQNLIATGYLLLGSKVLGTFDKEQLTLDVIDEQIDTLGKSLLGMTLGCARCHDHKFDPLPQADYYAIAGILGSTSSLVDRIGGPKDDESDWERRGLGTGGDEKLIEFLRLHRYDWVKSVSKRFEAQKKMDSLAKQLPQDAQRPQKSQDDPLLSQWERARDEFEEADRRLEELLARMPPHAMAVRESEQITDLAIRIRGVPSNRGAVVARGFFKLVATEAQPPIPVNQSGRLELAQWLTSSHNPLTARVFVNRVWKHLFRQGIVRSVDNFGTTGELPTHPELLDDLALRFIENRWDLKLLVREIVLSDAYQRAVRVAPLSDPENRLLASQNRRRLEAEEIRDSLLSFSGQLLSGANEDILRTLPIGDISNLGDYLAIQDNRRTVYQPVIRTLEHNVLQLFDAANNTMVTGARPRTIVAPQSLYFLNSQFVQDSAKAIGDGLLSAYTSPSHRRLPQAEYEEIADQMLEKLMQTIAFRSPNQQEIDVLRNYLRSQADGQPGLTAHDMLKLCQTVICSTQFQFLE
jgi:hypothetical protein